MRLLGVALLGLLAFAVLSTAIKAAAIIIVLLIVIALTLEPRRTFGTIVGLIYIGLLGKYPVPMIALSIILVIFALIEQRTR